MAIAEAKAREIVENILAWVDENKSKARVVDVEGKVIAETTNIAFEKQDSGYTLRKANGYITGRIRALFDLDEALSEDKIIAYAQIVDSNGKKLIEDYKVGVIYAGEKSFTVSFEIALPYVE